ncbi:MAG: MerR family transcriptional regulator [Pirellulales bacterium]
MSQLVTPKQVARAIQVSESSVKRWCDKGIILTSYTAGGHRRIKIAELLLFLKSSNHQLVRPEIIGLPATSGQSVRVIERAAVELSQAFLKADEEKSRQIIFDLFLADHSVSVICDKVFVKAFETIGDQWECGEAEVFQERHGCEIATRVLHELRTLIVSPRENSPRAIGGTVENDPYSLAALMVELVLRNENWNASYLGTNLPFATLSAAIKKHQPRFFWLSVNYIEDVDQFIKGYSDLYNEHGTNVAFVLGGELAQRPSA